MRTIKFKGKRVNYDEWVEGDLIHGVGLKQGKTYILPLIENLATIKNCDPLDGCEVLKETVGQFTGLTDKNGKEIFELDIIDHYAFYGHVVYENGMFSISSNANTQFCGCKQPLAYHNVKEMEVIGNIHDKN